MIPSFATKFERSSPGPVIEKVITMSDAVIERVSIYQPKQVGLKFPAVPVFDNYAAHRQHLKERLVAACRAFALHDLDYGFAGHLTVRDPEFPNLYWTNPMAVHFSQVKVSNLICADHEGYVVEGRHAINRAGFVLHALHRQVTGVVDRLGVLRQFDVVPRPPEEAADLSLLGTKRTDLIPGAVPHCKPHRSVARLSQRPVVCAR